MSDAPVLYETDGHVAILTLNRPGAMNAFDESLRDALAAAQKKAEANENVRVIILTGAGRAFSAGTDVKELVDDMGMEYDISISLYKPLIDAVTKSDKIYIAALNGIAGGVALGLVMGSDLTIMSDKARIFSPFANIGLVPDGGSSWFLLNHLGYKRAFQAIAECTQLDAQTCLETGMVNKVVPHDTLQVEARRWAKSLAERSPLALAYSKKILRAAATKSLADTQRLESEYQTMAIGSEDATNAIKAFLNKEKPVFKGQ